MNRRITDIDELAGKTIARAIFLTNYHDDGSLGILFSDGTYAIMSGMSYDEASVVLHEEATAEGLIELGVGLPADG